MSAFDIIGTGSYLPGEPYDNHALARVMDTNDEWIRKRTGIRTRHYCPDGAGVSDLGFEAARLALADAKRRPEDIDYVLFNTMTPDHIFPGSAPLLAHKLGCRPIPALDLRTQCGAMLYSLQVADALLKSGAAKSILVVGAEAHAGFMPWRDWKRLREDGATAVPEADFERATSHRSLAIIFGDGAGAFVAESAPGSASGILATDICSDGAHVDKLYIKAGFRQRPFITQETVDNDEWIPRMQGRELFRAAVTLLPESVRRVCDKAGTTLGEVDWFVAHQANQRINEAVRTRLELPAEKFPSNIDRVGNTSSATIPILIDEMRRDGRLKPGMLVCFLALGAGLHWGSVLWRA